MLKSKLYPLPERLLKIADTGDELARTLRDEWYLPGADAMQNPGQILWPRKPDSCLSLTDTIRLHESHQRITSAVGAAKEALTDIILEDFPSESEQKKTSLIHLLRIVGRTVTGWPHDVLAALRWLSETFKTVEDALDPRNTCPTEPLTLDTVGVLGACAMILRREVAKKQGAAETTKSLPTKQKGLTAAEFNPLAGDYLKEHATEKHQVTVRELADDLKSKNPAGTCSTGTVSNLPAWWAYQEGLERDRKKSRKARPTVVAFTPKLEAIIVDDDELQRLTGEQAVDRRAAKICQRM